MEGKEKMQIVKAGGGRRLYWTFEKGGEVWRPRKGGRVLGGNLNNSGGEELGIAVKKVQCEAA